ncbi:hypothetical protein BDN72DRAFT_880062 [Pluteus cervinus]|uniref:Uncharacterized protein n=1 Tax=Pluteus cervinus TaxID=181527 RepID=A0ACD3AM96_9AGAR|nr:hypothetical protein BDN72DRAFT_880062 [Pluteus cervinus]
MQEGSWIDSDPGHGSNIAELAGIDARITELLEQIRQLRDRRNSLVPINRLPVELLVRIFSLAQDLENAEKDNFYNWVVVTHVSRHWRSIALQEGSLWRDIIYRQRLDTQRWSMESFHRSGSWNLSVHAVLRYSYEVDMISSILSQMHRIQSIDCSGILGLSKIQNLVQQLEQPAPLIEEVKLRNISDTQSISLFSGVAPRLSSLSLLATAIVWDSDGLMFHNLTKLELSSIPTPIRPQLDEILNLLSHTRHLESLYLSGAFSVTETSESSEFIHLPALSSIFIGASESECIPLLSSITFPASVQVDVRLSCLGHRNYNPQSFFRTLANTSSDRARRISHLDIRWGPYDTARYTCWDEDQEEQAIPRISISVYTASRCASKAQWLEATQALSFLRLRKLVIKGSEAEPFHVFSPFTTSTLLSTIITTDIFLPGFIQSIDDNARAFPGLLNLTISFSGEPYVRNYALKVSKKIGCDP